MSGTDAVSIQVPVCARCGTLITGYHNCVPAGSTTIKQPLIIRVREGS